MLTLFNSLISEDCPCSVRPFFSMGSHKLNCEPNECTIPCRQGSECNTTTLVHSSWLGTGKEGPRGTYTPHEPSRDTRKNDLPAGEDRLQRKGDPRPRSSTTGVTERRKMMYRHVTRMGGGPTIIATRPKQHWALHFLPNTKPLLYVLHSY